MSQAVPEVLRAFVEQTRALWREPLSDQARWQRIGALAHELLGSAPLQERAKSWPEPGPERKRAVNLLFYEDPDYGFVINGLIKGAKAGTPVHDHAHTWTVYGVLAGEERIVRYRNVAGAAAAGQVQLEKTDDYVVKPGFVDVVPPGILHAEYAGDQRTVAVIIRSERVGGFLQSMVDPNTGTATQAPGPEQIPYTL